MKKIAIVLNAQKLAYLMIPGPIFLILWPLIAALLVFVLQRWPIVASLVGVVAISILGVTVSGIDLQATGLVSRGLIVGESWILLGRTLTLTEQVRTTLLIVSVGMAFLFLLSLALPQGKLFVSINLILLSVMAAALMVRPFVFGALLLLIIAGALAVLIQGDRAGSTLASFRYLTMAALAVPLLLVAGWMAETNQAQFLAPVSRLFVAALVIFLASFPFHVWVAPTVTEAHSLVPVVVFGFIQFMLLVFFFDILRDNPAALSDMQFLRIMQVSGALTVVVAGVLVLIARSLSHLLGYLILFDIGATVLSIAFGGRVDPVETTLSLLVLRTVSLTLAGFGLGLIRRQVDPARQGIERIATSRGLAWRTPLGVALFVYGGLSLAGLPLTPGFSGRWALVTLAGEQSPFVAALLVMAVVAGAVGVLRCLPPLLAPSTDLDQPVVPESNLMRVAAGLILAIGMLMALLPQAFLTSTRHLSELF